MIVFLVRHYNDIDHIVPIIYRMLKDKAANLQVFCMDPFLDIHHDFRLKYLKEKFGCNTRYIYQACLPSIRHRLFYFFVCQLPHWRLPRYMEWISKVNHQIASRIFNSRWRKQLYGRGWAKRFLQANGVQCLVIDFTKKDRFIYASIGDASEELGVRKVGVPHGLELSTNLDWTNKNVAQKNPRNILGKRRWLDEFVVQSEGIKAKSALVGLPVEHIFVLGSTRYCEEWLNVYHDILPPQPVPYDDDDKLKVLYFDHSSEFRVNREEVVNSLRAISALDFVQLVVKPSPRGSLSDERLAALCRIDLSTHSVHLIRGADVVISWISSIVLEVYNLNKIFLYPTYFHQNHQLWEDYKACWSVSNLEDLLQALHAIHNGTFRLPYSDANVKAFLDEVVYGGKPGMDVLRNYVDFIISPKG